MVIRFATASVSWGANLVHLGEPVGHRDGQLLASGALGDAGADLVGERELAAEVVCALGADPEVGEDSGDPVLVAHAGAGRPAVAELVLLVDEAELLPLVGLRLDPADLIRGRLVVEQQHDQAPDWLQSLVAIDAGELVAGRGGEVAALPVVDEHWPVSARAVADAGDQLAAAAQHRGEPLDPLL